MKPINSAKKRTWKNKVRPVQVDGDICRVLLKCGAIAIVDVGDRHLVEGWNWCSQRGKNGKVSSVIRTGKGKPLRLGRLILGLRGRAFADHKDGDPLNNRRSNLRKATPRQNKINSKLRCDSKTGFKGVSPREDGRFRARIALPHRRIHLGYFADAVSTALAYDAAAKRHFGAFARLNFNGGK